RIDLITTIGNTGIAATASRDCQYQCDSAHIPHRRWETLSLSRGASGRRAREPIGANTVAIDAHALDGSYETIDATRKVRAGEQRAGRLTRRTARISHFRLQPQRRGRIQ